MDSPLEHYNSGIDLAAAGKVREAIDEFRIASRLDTTDSDALSEIGRLEIAEERLGAAVSALDEALSRNPGHAGALNNRAVVDFLKGHFAEAAEGFRAAVGENPNLSEAWFNLADTCEELGDLEGKEKASLRYRELSDDN